MCRLEAEQSSANVRVWPVFALVPAAMLGAALLTGAVVTVAALATTGEVDEDELLAFARTPLGVSLVIVPSQMVFLAAALCAALVSPLGARRRLALGAPRIPLAACALLVLGTLGVQGIIQLLSPLLGEPSENLVELANMLGTGTGTGAVFVTVLASVLPGLCEELFFRGYAQTRLVLRFGAPLAILFCSALFALAHFDPQHVVAVFPLGVWLGVIAWLAGSIWPAVIAHALNNAFAVIVLRLSADPADPTNIGAPPGAWSYALFAAALLAGVAGILLARLALRRPPVPQVGADATAPPG